MSFEMITKNDTGETMSVSPLFLEILFSHLSSNPTMDGTEIFPRALPKFSPQSLGVCSI